MEYKWKKSGLGMKELFRKFVENMKNGKIKKDRLFIAFLTGVLMLVIAIPSETGQKRKENSQKNAESFRVDSTKTMSQSDYTAYMEERLETILSQIEGAGKVQVMITWKTNGEKIIEKDRQNREEHVSEKDNQGGNRTTSTRDTQETTVYDSGNRNSSEQEPYVSKELSPKAEGVIVIAPGGDDAVVVKNITEAVQALFEIDTHKIRIMKGGRAN